MLTFLAFLNVLLLIIICSFPTLAIVFSKLLAETYADVSKKKFGFTPGDTTILAMRIGFILFGIILNVVIVIGIYYAFIQ